MSEPAENLKALAERWIEVGWQRGDADALLALHAPDFVDHAAPSDREPTREGFAEGVRELYRAFPDFYATVDDLIIDVTAARIAVRWSARGTQRGVFMGYPASGRPITCRGIEIIHIAAGLTAERWGEWDGLDLRQQLAGG